MAIWWYKDSDKEEYESRYTGDERQAIDDAATAAQERDRNMEERLKQSADRAAALQQQGGDGCGLYCHDAGWFGNN